MKQFGMIQRRLAGFAFIVLGLGFVGTPQAVAVYECDGRPATIWGSKSPLEGTPKDDVIVVTGNDPVVQARGGDDLVCGSLGTDEIHLGKGNDRAFGGYRGDDLFGGPGSDELHGPSDPPVATADGADNLIGGTGDDHLYGGLDSDWLVGDAGSDFLNGGSGEKLDFVSYEGATKGVTVNLANGEAHGQGDDTIEQVEKIFASRYSDFLTGDSKNNFIYGWDGEDVLSGGSGIDRLNGMKHSDEIYGGPDHDLLETNGGWDSADGSNDLFDGGDGSDRLSYENVLDPIHVNLLTGTVEGDGADTLESVESVEGGRDRDTFIGNDVANTFYGWSRQNISDASNPAVPEVMQGNGGPDRLVGGTEMYGGQGDDVILAENAPSFPNENLPAFISGGPDDDLLHGDCLDDTIDGGTGNDVIRPGPGDDDLEGGEGTDSLSFLRTQIGYGVPRQGVLADLESGSASLRWQAVGGSAPCEGEKADYEISGFENLDGTAYYDDTLYGDDNANVLHGLLGKDQLFGRAGDDHLDGDEGKDSLDGGEGTDTCIDGETTSSCET